MSVKVLFRDMPKLIKDMFIKGEVMIRVGCWIARRWFCPAVGGCDMVVSDGEDVMLVKRGYRGSHELPLLDTN